MNIIRDAFLQQLAAILPLSVALQFLTAVLVSSDFNNNKMAHNFL